MAGKVTLYQEIGGRVTCRKLSEALYAHIAKDPLLRPLFPGKTFKCAIEEFSAFLAQFLGGPSEDTQKRWWLSLRESHLRFDIGQEERDAWMKSMLKALEDVPFEEPMRGALRGFFEEASTYLINRGPACPVAHSSGVQQEILERWEGQQRLDEAVSAVRERDATRAIGLAEKFFFLDLSMSAALLALMIASGENVMLEYVRKRLVADPTLTRARYSGRTLMHAAAAAGDLKTVELLVDLGADPNVATDGGRTPLYCVANEYQGADGSRVVHFLVKQGAKIDARDRVKRCTALHMAARRGHFDAAEALLDCGANIEARDSLGDTPLRRAVNCGKINVARLLITRGADIHSRGSKNLTPLLAAHTETMRELLDAVP